MAKITVIGENVITGTRPISNAGAEAAAAGAQIGFAKIRKGQQMMETGLKFAQNAAKATTNASYSDALGKATLRLNGELQQRLTQTVDADGNPTFATLVDDVGAMGQQIKSDIGSKIADFNARNKFNESFDKLLINKQILAQGQARTQQIDFARNKLISSVETLKEQALVDDPAQASHFVNEVNGMVETAHRAGAITQKEAIELKEKARIAIRVGSVQNIIRTEPEMAKALLESATPAMLGVKHDEFIQLKNQADAQIRDQQRQQDQVAREQEALHKEQQNLHKSKLDEGILRGIAGEADVEKSFISKQITQEQKVSLLKKLDKFNKTARKKAETKQAISVSMQEGKPLALEYTPKQIGEHYQERIASIFTDGQPPSITDKANVVKDYVAPVKPFQKELSHNLQHGNDQTAVESLRAFESVQEQNPLVLEGMDKDALAIASTAKAMLKNTNLSDQEAIRIARDRVLNADDPVRRERASEYRKIDDFKEKNIKGTIQETLDIEGFLGFGEKDIAPGMKETFKRLYEEAYVATGDKDAAVELVKSQTQNLYGATEINPDGTEKVMLLPPEKVLPGVDPQLIKENVHSEVSTLLPPEISTEQVLLQSDELTKNDLSYGLFYADEFGALHPIRNEEGDIMRWQPDEQGLHEEQSNRALEAAQTERQERLEKGSIDSQGPLGTSGREIQQQIKNPREVKPVDKSLDATSVRRGPQLSSRMRNKIPSKRRRVVGDAIEAGAQVAGVNADLLAAIAKAESQFNPSVRNRSGSTATGLFQFIRGTWKGMVKKYGKKYGIGIGDIRNPKANAIMGALFTRDNIRFLQRKLGREPTSREVYLAHFSGAGKALEVIRAVQNDPNGHVSKYYRPIALKQNPTVLKGTIKQSYLRLTNKVVRNLK